MPKQLRHVRLGVNIDHVATVRNARDAAYPDPVRAAEIAIAAGADSITAHLREDRRHIRDADMHALKARITKPLNFEMAATDEMKALACAIQPHAVCLVPEKRTEITTEGGLDVASDRASLVAFVGQLREAGIRVSLFIDPSLHQIEAAQAVGAPVVELHTGRYADHLGEPQELERLQKAARHAHSLGLECHAGHGLTTANVGPIAAIPEIVELNIGHFLVGEAIMIGLPEAIRQIRMAIDRAAG
jgi:pyridoxine 5-phosphate synthase